MATALVTGSSQRLGKAMAIALARRGYDVALHYRHSGEKAAQTASEIEQLGVTCKLFSADLDDWLQAEALIAEVSDQMDSLEILVNSASSFLPGSIAQMDKSLFKENWGSNFLAPMVLMRDFAKACQAGMVVNMLDQRITKHGFDYAVYSLAKKALAELTMIAAREFAPNIRVNGIAPGFILPAPGADEHSTERLLKKIPLKKQGGIEDIQRALLYLLNSDFVTGQVMFVDGGEHLA